jgi:peptidoglycan hydrolase-like protein with peptidoglycan-binding domain
VIRYRNRGTQIARVQAALITLGYDVGVTGADGIYGRKTEAAITHWASDHCVARQPRRLHDAAITALLEMASDDPAPVEVTPVEASPELVSVYGETRYTVSGVDTSGHQKSSALDLVAMAKTEAFHIVKVTEDSGYVFKDAAARLDAIRRTGRLAGEYHFFRPSDGWKDDLDHYLKHSCYQPGDLPPMNDLEKGKRRKWKNGNPRPAGRTEANYNVNAAYEFGARVAEKLKLDYLLLYFTSPSWQWYMREADDDLLTRLATVYRPVWAEYVRKDKQISADPSLLRSFKFPKWRKAVKDGAPWAAPVIHQWTGKGRVPAYASGKKDIDRCLMTQALFDEVTG